MKKHISKYKKPIITTALVLVFILGYFMFLDVNTKTAAATWWNDSWSYRKAITINSDQVTADLENFPMLVSLTDTALSKAQDDGDDIIFVNFEGKKLSHEIESFASSTGVLLAWVKMPTLSGTEDAEIFMYYGNTSVANQEDVENVWSDAYSAVYHMNSEGTAGELDSTSNNNDLSVTGTVGATSTSKLGLAREIASNGLNYLSVADNETLDGMSELTIQAWVRDTQNDAVPRAIVAKRLESTSEVSYASFVFTDRYFYFDNGNSTGTGNDTRLSTDTEVAVVNTWQMLHFVYDETDKTIYLDGVEAISSSTHAETTIYDGTAPLTIGILNQGYGNSWIGQFDEVRIVRDVLSSDWIATEHNNQNNPSLFITPQTEEIGPGPIGYWSFDEGYGTTAHDESSGGNDGTITGSTWKDESECVSGKCLYFSGVNDSDFVSMGDMEVTKNLDDEISVSAWVRLSSYPSGEHTIVAHESIFKIDIKNTGQVRFLTGNNWGGAILTSNESLDLNKWYFIEAVYDGANKYIYINSSQDDNTFSVLGDLGSGSGREASIAVHDNSTWADEFHGYIDEVKVYPYARTADQIKQDYNAGLSGVETRRGASVSFGGTSDKWLSDGLVGYWKMDESATTTGAIDSSGNGNDGTYEGTASTTGGKFGRGGVFNGAGAVDINSTVGDDLDISGDVTISAWFYADSWRDSSYDFLLRKNSSSGWNYQFVQRGDSGLLSISSEDTVSSTYGFAYIARPTAGSWHHLVGIRKGNLLQIYLDGVKGEDATCGEPRTGAGNINIGAMSSAGSLGFSGKIDEVRTYNRALSPDEVRKLYEWAPGPVLHLKMDEKNGTSTYDISGSGNDGVFATTASSPTWTRGRYGTALDFDGVDDVATVANSPSLQFDNTSSFTISTWIKRGEQSNTTIGFLGNAEYQGGGYMLNASMSGDRIGFVLNDNATEYNTYSGAASFPEDTWIYVTGVFDGTSIYLYLDGVEVSNSSAKIATNTSDFLIGNGQQGGWGYFFNSTIDDVRIYNYARTQKQILEDMNGGKPALKSPVLDLSFDEGVGDTAYDSSIHKNNGTLYASTSGSNTIASAMWSLDGRDGGAMEFDGTDDYVVVPLDFLPETSTDVGISFWAKTISGADRSIIQAFPDDNANRVNIHMTYYNYSSDLVYWDWGDITTGGRLYFAWDPLWDDVMAHWVFISEEGVGKRVYRNNILVASDTTTSTFTKESKELYLGDYNHIAYWDGILDEFKIYSYALNEDEVKTLYNDSKTIVMGQDASRDNNGTTTTGTSKKYCIPGDSSQCDAPVLKLNMDEKNGTTAYDTSGNGNDGTISGANWGRGKYGSALSFDGSDDYVNAGSNSITGTSAFTMNAWLKKGTHSDYGLALFMGNGASTNAAYLGWVANAQEGTSNSIGGGFYGINYGSGVDDELWHYVSLSFSGGVGGNAILYVDGQQNLTDIYTPDIQSDAVYLGMANTGTPYYYRGAIDNVTIYNYARTPAQIAYDYNGGKPIAHYKFDECSGSTIHDESGNGNHGTLNLGAGGVTATGTCASSSDSFWYNGKDGKVNNGGSFDGVSDYISIPRNSALEPEEISVSTWVKIPSGSDFNYILGKYDTGSASYGFSLGSVGKSFFGVNTDVSGLLYSQDGGNIADDAWHHLLGTYTKTSLKFYVDGVYMGETVVSNRDISYNTSNDLIIGNNGNDTYFFEGQMDEVKIWNYALTAEQVKGEYNGGAVRFGN